VQNAFLQMQFQLTFNATNKKIQEKKERKNRRELKSDS